MATPLEPRTRRSQGDYQTPLPLARELCRWLAAQGLAPASVVEPCCGTGAFLLAALEAFPSLTTVLGVELNPDHLTESRARLTPWQAHPALTVEQANFFEMDWPARLAVLPAPLLVLGNPPWVTNATQGSLNADNLPPKANFQARTGLAALTGASNFDISEWMLLHLLEALRGRDATLAVLCKTSVARRLLAHLWAQRFPLGEVRLYRVDAKAHFQAAVEAGFLVISLGAAGRAPQAAYYLTLEATTPQSTFGWVEAELVADVTQHQRWHHLAGRDVWRWRSGIKHDCAPVMLLTREEEGYHNGLGVTQPLEERYLYPLVKSSDLAPGKTGWNGRWVLVPQQRVGADTRPIAELAPLTWAYLERHRAHFERRKSRIYRNQPPFAIFGVGDYSFAPWKVAVAGLARSLHAVVLEPVAGKPVIPDDTCYFLPCQSQGEAELVAGLVNSAPAQAFYAAHIFWDAKRPIMAAVLERLDLVAVAREVGQEAALLAYQRGYQGEATPVTTHQPRLL